MNASAAGAPSRRGDLTMPLSVAARPYDLIVEPATTALVVIDMQRDFLEPGGFGELLGNDVSLLSRVVEPLARVLAAARAAGIPVIHTREGHRPDLSDCPPSKLARGRLDVGIGSPGPKGRVLVRGEEGHDIVDELRPIGGEVVLDKPGKGSFYATDLELLLRNAEIKSLIVTGVTTEVCVHTTVREANDRGFECLVLEDCVGSYFPEFHRVALEMISAQGGIFGWVTHSSELLAALARATAEPALVGATEGA
jgi:nicotinamidase-related amidase